MLILGGKPVMLKNVLNPRVSTRMIFSAISPLTVDVKLFQNMQTCWAKYASCWCLLTCFNTHDKERAFYFLIDATSEKRADEEPCL